MGHKNKALDNVDDGEIVCNAIICQREFAICFYLQLSQQTCSSPARCDFPFFSRYQIEYFSGVLYI